MRRVVEPELLDDLPPADPRAIGSRADLRRLNFLMGHAGILSRALAENSFCSRPLRMVELGAGDGTFLLRLAQHLTRRGVTAQATLIDRQELVSTETRRAFTALGWTVESVANDVFAWLEQAGPMVDVMLTNLFLHHFSETSLATLLRLASRRTNLFLACEPRRSRTSLTAARWLRLLGCNGVTRHDAVLSAGAGFAGRELSALWPEEGPWQLGEQSAGMFSHCFMARKKGNG